MSLDVYLTEDGTDLLVAADLLEEHGMDRASTILRERGTEPPHLYEGNITHNLGKMAEAAGIYQHLWRPEELGITRGGELIGPLREGLALLRAEPERFWTLRPANGWGSYGGLVQFVTDYLAACEAHPEARVRASR